MASPKPFRADSYRKPYGVRERSDSGYGYGKGNRSTTTASSRAREALPVGVSLTAKSQAAWEAVEAPLRRSMRDSVWALWIIRLRLAGERNDALYLVGHDAEWVRRCYAKQIGSAVREHTDYRGVFVCDD